MTPTDAHDQALPEFVFGTLSTPEGRARRARSAGFGFYHDATTEPPDPQPGVPITVAAQAGAGVAVEAATLSFTVDGSAPDPAEHRRLYGRIACRPSGRIASAPALYPAANRRSSLRGHRREPP